MSYSQENGYIPTGIGTIVSNLRVRVNEIYGTTYTAEQFVGSNFYKFYYALAQELSANEIKTSEIFAKLQQYIEIVNAKISRPVNTNPGIVDKMLAEGYVASVKPMVLADAGKINICVDLDDTDPDYATTKAAVALLISQITVGGGVTQGAESTTIVLSNGQSFDFKYHLPNKIPVELRLTLTTSENNQEVILGPDVIKENLLANINARYSLGKNFEPQKYFNIADDAPWAGNVLLEYSDDAGATWESDIFDANFDDLFTFGLDDITLVEV